MLCLEARAEALHPFQLSSSRRELPEFDSNLHLTRGDLSDLGGELAHHVRADFAARYGPIDA